MNSETIDLKTCRQCGHEIKSGETACSQCGLAKEIPAPDYPRFGGGVFVFFWIFFIILIILLLVSMFTV
jgi:hypothetical protein